MLVTSRSFYAGLISILIKFSNLCKFHWIVILNQITIVLCNQWCNYFYLYLPINIISDRSFSSAMIRINHNIQCSMSPVWIGYERDTWPWLNYYETQWLGDSLYEVVIPCLLCLSARLCSSLLSYLCLTCDSNLHAKALLIREGVLFTDREHSLLTYWGWACDVTHLASKSSPSCDGLLSRFPNLFWLCESVAILQSYNRPVQQG